jgi:hypothetical protein
MSTTATANFAQMDKHQLAATWQVRCLRAAQGKFASVMLTIFFFNYYEQAQYLLWSAYGRNRDIAFPFHTGGATIVNSGQVVCDLNEGRLGERFKVRRNVKVFDTEGELIREFRNLADELKLDDPDRVAMTEAVKKWIVADMRINYLGQRIAS